MAELIDQSDLEKQETEAIKRTFRKIQQHVEMMVEMFKRSRFYLSVASRMNYDEGFVFNENNIIQSKPQNPNLNFNILIIIIIMSEVKSRIPLEGNYRKGWQLSQEEQVIHIMKPIGCLR